MFCNDCGAQVKDGAEFCPNCGKSLKGILPRSAASQAGYDNYSGGQDGYSSYAGGQSGYDAYGSQAGYGSDSYDDGYGSTSKRRSKSGTSKRSQSSYDDYAAGSQAGQDSYDNYGAYDGGDGYDEGDIASAAKGFAQSAGKAARSAAKKAGKAAGQAGRAAGSAAKQASKEHKTAVAARAASAAEGPKLAENEVIVKRYHCSRVKKLFTRCEGYMIVTNKRLLFQAEGGNILYSRISKEIALDKVTGLDCYYGTNINFIFLILGIVLFGGSFSIMKEVDIFAGLLVLVLGAALVYFAFRKSFNVTVYASECAPTPIAVGEGAITLQGNAVFYAVVSKPTEDTNRMMTELGALVHDLQSMGDMAIDKWKR